MYFMELRHAPPWLRNVFHPTSSAEARPVYGREEADPVFRPA